MKTTGALDAILMDGECVDSVFDLKVGFTQSPVNVDNILLLTNKRLIHMFTKGGSKGSTFLLIRQISSIEVNTDRNNFGTYIWAGAAFLVAGLLWRIIDHPAGSITAAIAVGLMGIYLIAEKIVGPNKTIVKCTTGSTGIHCEIIGADANVDIHRFVTKVFQAQENYTLEPSPTERHSIPWW